MSNIYSKCRTAVLLLIFIALSATSQAQKILLVNDNDNIVYNTDTLKSALSHTIYSSYRYWSIPDSAGAFPSAAFMDTFDAVIWYCSTDGVGLKFWSGTAASGNPELITYASTGKPLWIIGLDILYQKFTTGSTFVAGDFPKDVMGLTSYDVQSYVDDASTGCPEADRISTASTLFPATIKWQFATLWYVDGCTADAGTLQLYQMGPSTYSLNGRKCMFHNKHTGISVMSTFFDPALIDSFSNRVRFLEKGITYLLPVAGVKNTEHFGSIKLYPNPATSAFTLEIDAERTSEVIVELYNAMGSRVRQAKTSLIQGTNMIETSLNELSAGIYLVKVTDAEGRSQFFGKLNKQ